MPVKFVSLVYFEGRLLAMTEEGAIWEFEPRYVKWSFLCEGPRRT